MPGLYTLFVGGQSYSWWSRIPLGAVLVLVVLLCTGVLTVFGTLYAFDFGGPAPASRPLPSRLWLVGRRFGGCVNVCKSG